MRATEGPASRAAGAAARLSPGQAEALRRVAGYVERRGAYPRAVQLGVRSAVLVRLWRRGLLDRGGWRFPVYAVTSAGQEALQRWATAAVAGLRGSAPE